MWLGQSGPSGTISAHEILNKGVANTESFGQFALGGFPCEVRGQNEASKVLRVGFH
jgi:hypothetical protein